MTTLNKLTPKLSPGLVTNFSRTKRGQSDLFPEGVLSFLTKYGSSKIGPDLQWSASGPVCDGNGGFTDELPVHDEGIWCGPSYTNLLADVSTWFSQYCDIDGGLTDKDGGSTAYRATVTDTVSPRFAKAVTVGTVVDRSFTFSIWLWADTPGVQVSLHLFSAGAAEDFDEIVTLTNTPTLYEIGGTFTDVSTGEYYSVKVHLMDIAVGNYIYFQDYQSVEGVGHFPHIPPGTTSASMAATSGNNGLAIKMSGERADGVELATNGDFSDGTNDWGSLSGAVITSSNGLLHVVGEAGDPYAGAIQEIVGQIGDTVTVTVDVFETYDRAICQLGTTVYDRLPAGKTTFTHTFTTEAELLRLVTGSTSSVSFRSVSIQKVVPYEETEILDCFRGKPDGVELVDKTAWASDNWDITDGELTVNSAVSYRMVYIGGVLATGSLYEICFSSGISAGELQVLDGITGDVIHWSESGTYKARFYAKGTRLAFRTTSNGATGSVTNISVQKVVPQPMTAIVGVTMGVGSDDIYSNRPLMSVKDVVSYNSVLFYSPGAPVKSTDGASEVNKVGIVWQALEVHYKVLQVSSGC